jgi:hypothetical protein
LSSCYGGSSSAGLSPFWRVRQRVNDVACGSDDSCRGASNNHEHGDGDDQLDGVAAATTSSQAARHAADHYGVNRHHHRAVRAVGAESRCSDKHGLR